MISVLSEEDYVASVRKIGGDHWGTYKERWKYHKIAALYIELLKIKESSAVLEMGTMGVSVVKGSDTVDFNPHWPLEGFRPTYEHDARITPWPFRDKQYEVFIALRVFHHLTPAQREAFLEAKRIAKHVILVVPDVYPQNAVAGVESRPINLQRFIEWNNGRAPTVYTRLDGWLGNFYYWDSAALS